MIVSIIGIFIWFNLNQYATEYADVVDSIRTDEETNHKVLLSKYVKAAITGGLTNLFPSVTNHEKIEAEKLMSEACPLFDPPLPETIEQLDAKICAYHDAICKDTESGSNFVKYAALINQHLNGLNLAKNKLIDNTLVIVHTNTTAKKLPLLCCSYWSFKAGLINALPTQQLQHYYAQSLSKCDGDVTKYLCLYHSNGSQACANLVIPPPPTNVTRFTSVTLAMIESVAKITQITL